MKNHILQAEHLIQFSGREKTAMTQENLMKGVLRPMTHIKRLINNQKGLGKIIVTMNLLVVGNNTRPHHELNSITMEVHQAETTIINRVMSTDIRQHHSVVIIVKSLIVLAVQVQHGNILMISHTRDDRLFTGRKEAEAEARRGLQITIKILGLRAKSEFSLTHQPLLRQFKSARTVQELALKKVK